LASTTKYTLDWRAKIWSKYFKKLLTYWVSCDWLQPKFDAIDNIVWTLITSTLDNHDPKWWLITLEITIRRFVSPYLDSPLFNCWIDRDCISVMSIYRIFQRTSSSAPQLPPCPRSPQRDLYQLYLSDLVCSFIVSRSAAV